MNDGLAPPVPPVGPLPPVPPIPGPPEPTPPKAKQLTIGLVNGVEFTDVQIAKLVELTTL